jgi:ubiquinone/menaquinone biosynthesis C-methylase UbiE
MSTQVSQQLTPQLFFQTLNAYQRTEALKAAIDLEVFTAIGENHTTADEIAMRCNVAERGARILCDFLCIMGFLTKTHQNYTLTPETAFFLDKRSPAYIGTMAEFMLSTTIREGFSDIAGAVRKGGTTIPNEGTVSPDHPIWVNFARSMAPMMAMPAEALAKMIDPNADTKLRVLDIAAGHGLYGLAFARNNPHAEVVALDWAKVLEVAKENATKAGVADRFNTIPGSAFDADYGSGYDIVLLTNFLHHFDPPTCEMLLSKVHAALNDGGRVATVEFVPNDDRISPPEAAGFSMQMLAGTPAGDAYTFAELEQMAANAGFRKSEIQPVPMSIEHVVISYK